MPEPEVLRSDLRPVTGAELRGGLQTLGLQPGGIVMVHASLSAFGWIVGGSGTVVRALFACLGDRGTICAQVSWEDIPFGIDEWPDEWREAYEADPPLFDPAVAEAAHFEGRLAERIRTWPGARRSANADTGVAAVGARSAWLVEPHEHDDGFGPGTPYARLVEAGGHVLLLGAPLHSISLLHHAEALADVPRKRRTRYRIPERVNGTIAWRHCEDIDVRRGPVPYERVVPTGSPPLGAIAAAALRAGVGRWTTIGGARCHLFPAPALVAFARAWIEERFAAAAA
jgi:aminoglycoside 3-N-acetyltransferase